jgi:hypothetical protein
VLLHRSPSKFQFETTSSLCRHTHGRLFVLILIPVVLVSFLLRHLSSLSRSLGFRATAHGLPGVIIYRQVVCVACTVFSNGLLSSPRVMRDVHVCCVALSCNFPSASLVSNVTVNLLERNLILSVATCRNARHTSNVESQER